MSVAPFSLPFSLVRLIGDEGAIGKHLNSLVRFLPVGAARSGSTVVSLDYEGVFLLALAVHGAAGPQDALSRRAIQHHRFKWSVLAVDLKSTDLP